jgi:hypothetical protein
MENLTKENFFNEMKEKYPKAMEHFCAWIDQYKIQVKWDELFSCHPWSLIHNRVATEADYDTHQRGQIAPHRYKYHDLPIGMQVGIFLEYLFKEHQLPDEPEKDLHKFASEEFTTQFKRIEEKLTNPKL